MIYMVCLDNFSLKCIIKNFYLISDDPLKSSTVGSELSHWLMLEASTIKLSKSGVPSKGQSQNLDLQLCHG